MTMSDKNYDRMAQCVVEGRAASISAMRRVVEKMKKERDFQWSVGGKS